MNERLVYFPVYFCGTESAGGSCGFTAWDGLTFHHGAVWTNASEGGTIAVSHEAAGATATIYTNAAKSGSAWSGTAATGAGTAWRVKGGGTCNVYITGTATSVVPFCGYVAFLINEDE
jgi:hypothetical protein